MPSRHVAWAVHLLLCACLGACAASGGARDALGKSEVPTDRPGLNHTRWENAVQGNAGVLWTLSTLLKRLADVDHAGGRARLDLNDDEYMYQRKAGCIAARLAWNLTPHPWSHLSVNETKFGIQSSAIRHLEQTTIDKDSGQTGVFMYPAAYRARETIADALAISVQTTAPEWSDLGLADWILRYRSLCVANDQAPESLSRHPIYLMPEPTSNTGLSPQIRDLLHEALELQSGLFSRAQQTTGLRISDLANLLAPSHTPTQEHGLSTLALQPTDATISAQSGVQMHPLIASAVCAYADATLALPPEALENHLYSAYHGPQRGASDGSVHADWIVAGNHGIPGAGYARIRSSERLEWKFAMSDFVRLQIFRVVEQGSWLAHSPRITLTLGEELARTVEGVEAGGEVTVVFPADSFASYEALCPLTAGKLYDTLKRLPPISRAAADTRPDGLP